MENDKNPELNLLYENYRDKITHLVASKVGDSSQVEDLVSVIFLKVSENYDRFDSSKASVSTWIYTVANRTIIDYYRTRKVHEEIPDDLSTDSALDDALLMEEQLEELAKALEKLSQKERDLIILHYYSNITLKEAAMRMKMSYANAKIIHKKALNNLRKMLA